MPTHLQIATEILAELKNENIISCENISKSTKAHYKVKLERLRDSTLKNANEEKCIAPGMVANVATTLLKVGNCQEHAQRFVLEYILKSKDQNVSLLFLSNEKNNDNHTLVLLGNFKGADHLITGKGNTSVEMTTDNDLRISIEDFFKKNKECLIVDPLNYLPGSQDDRNKILEYCKKNNITHLCAIRHYATTTGIIEAAPVIKASAEKIAVKSNTTLNLEILNDVNQKLEIDLSWVYLSKRNCYMIKNKSSAPLDKIKDTLIKNGFTQQECGIVEGINTKEPILFIKNAATLDAFRLMSITEKLLLQQYKVNNLDDLKKAVTKSLVGSVR